MFTQLCTCFSESHTTNIHKPLPMQSEQQRTKRVFLEFTYDYDFLLLGIVSREKFHRLVWLINESLGQSFAHTGELELFENEKVSGAFTKYEYTDELNHLDFVLLENKDESSYLIPEMRTVDYFMMIKGALDFVDVKVFTQNLQPIDSIQLITEIDPQKLKSKQNLIF
jgi:hypothetical protein